MCMKKIYLSLKDSQAENIKNQIQLKSVAYFCENLHLQSCFTRVLNNSKMYSSSILFYRESLVILRNHTLVFTKGVCAPSTLLSPKKSIKLLYILLWFVRRACMLLSCVVFSVNC